MLSAVAPSGSAEALVVSVVSHVILRCWGRSAGHLTAPRSENQRRLCSSFFSSFFFIRRLAAFLRSSFLSSLRSFAFDRSAISRSPNVELPSRQRARPHNAAHCGARFVRELQRERNPGGRQVPLAVVIAALIELATSLNAPVIAGPSTSVTAAATTPTTHTASTAYSRDETPRRSARARKMVSIGVLLGLNAVSQAEMPRNNAAQATASH